MSIHLDVKQLEQQIQNLLVQYPELADDDVLRADMFEGCGLNDTIAKLVEKAAEADSMAAAIKVRQSDLAARKARYERQEQAFRNLIQHLMERADLKKITLPEATLSIAFRKPAPVIEDETALPDECCKFIRKPEMATIKAWCEKGNVPDGVRMSNGSTSLSIRVR